MNKAVLLSINHKRCVLIEDGKKSIEIRKTRPKLEPPFRCYIYRTLPKWGDWCERDGRIIGEFVCNKITKVRYNTAYGFADIADRERSGMTAREVVEYGRGGTLYGWHISDLVIYRIPRRLDSLRIECKGGCDIPYVDAPPCDHCGKDRLTQPPGGWCYVKEMETNND